MRVTTNLLIWRRLRKTIAFVNKINDIATTNYSHLETSAIKVSDQDCTCSYRYQLIIQ